MIGNWEKHEIWIGHECQEYSNYVWESSYAGEVVKQQVSVETTFFNSDRGNFKAGYDVCTLIDVKRFLTNYYFFEEVARAEVEAWAKVINKTIDSEFLGILVAPETLERKATKYFTTLLSPVKLIFSDCEVETWRFDAVLVDNRFELDSNDLFPRYYIHEDSAIIEEKHWIDTWLRKYQKLQKRKQGKF